MVKVRPPANARRRERAASTVSADNGSPVRAAANARIAPPAPTPRPRVENPATVEALPGAATHGAALASLHHLLALEQKIRQVPDPDELQALAVNETRRLTGSRQSFFLQRKGQRRFEVRAVSSIAVLDRDTPLIRWIEDVVLRLHQHGAAAKSQEFDLPAFCDVSSEEACTFPFKYFSWEPLALPDGTLAGGLLQARETPWPESGIQLSQRLAQVIAHAWSALVGNRRLKPARRSWRWLKPLVAVLLAAAMAIPVPMTVLAPVEVVARNPYVIAAPLDGVIADVTAPANTSVAAGTVLLTYDSTVLRNRAAIAQREVGVARARFMQSAQGAFTDPQARHELAVTRAEFELKQAERTFAGEQLAMATVRAPRSGLLIHAGIEKWKGRPVSTGERIMEIADPARVALRIDLAVADALVLEAGAHARVFLDAHPLDAIVAKVETGTYHATPRADGTLAYEVRAALGSDEQPPRIGARGVAQVFGRKTPLFFFLFRRPIAALRQRLGF